MIINSANIKALSLLGQKGSVFNYGLLEAAAEHDNLRLLTADLALLTGLDRFRRKYPERFLQVGIAEQNMIGIAAGLAMEGEMPIATTYCSFLAVRDLEQVRQNVSCKARRHLRRGGRGQIRDLALGYRGYFIYENAPRHDRALSRGRP